LLTDEILVNFSVVNNAYYFQLWINYIKGKEMKLNDLLKVENPLVICNVWDVSSAKIAEKLGFKVIGTSSGAIATMLGYNDGEEISFDELLYIVKRIKANTDLPFTVDVESGYSTNTSVIIKNLQKLIQLGVAGINIEDSTVSQERRLVDPDIFSKTINEIVTEFNHKLFINVRTDTYLLDIPDKLSETLTRIEKYEKAGAHGIFVPCLTDHSDIEKICSSTKLPINVMCMPDLPDFATLYDLGVKRISMGNFVYNKNQNNLEQLLLSISTERHFRKLFV
jgi:2-methylisocitrate lyase-like PEP mutase family enzyme